MKKTISIMLIIFCFVAMIPMTSCSNEYERISLTEDNYENYIAINVYADSFIHYETGTAISHNSCFVLHVKTAKRAECKFEAVTITLKDGQKLNLDYEGNAYVSTIRNGGLGGTISNVADDISNAREVSKISGYVLVPKGINK